ncbi:MULTISPECIES: chalcone isomerase family protein [Flavobacterium]|uniref:Chalcone isomerase family protein n=1 Tax=Flavobacterium jumunjinense TaxID=998845 RepID=A0ABV5GV05_9FLAO|nr:MULTISPECIES: chalcone isomerase family protein [Flavobacterium]
MKKRIFTFLIVVMTTMTSLQAQKTVSGVKLDENITVEGKNLTLNGAGIREKFWIDLYVGSLYLPKKSSNASEIINSNDAAVIKLDIVSGMITSEKMISAVDEGFQNATGGKTDALKTKIDQFKSFFKDEFNKGDSFIIANVPGSGVVVYKNGTKKGTIDGADFKKALFGIWLSGKPADKDLKNSMLGK